jgi:hypothetical protein
MGNVNNTPVTAKPLTLEFANGIPRPYIDRGFQLIDLYSDYTHTCYPRSKIWYSDSNCAVTRKRFYKAMLLTADDLLTDPTEERMRQLNSTLSQRTPL